MDDAAGGPISSGNTREIRAKHAFLRFARPPQLAVEVSIQPFRRLGVDAVIVFSDILIPAEAHGPTVELGDAGPNLPNPVRSKLDVERLKIFDPRAETGLPPGAIRRIVKSSAPSPRLGFGGSSLDSGLLHGRGQDQGRICYRQKFSLSRTQTFRELLHRIRHGNQFFIWKSADCAGATAVHYSIPWSAS